MTDPFDTTRLPPPDEIPTHGTARTALRPAPGEKFVRGPLPLGWVRAAARLPGKALAVGMELWFLSGCARDRTVSVTLARLRRAGMSEDTARRAVRHLEAAGLVSVERGAGRAMAITLNPAPNGIGET